MVLTHCEEEKDLAGEEAPADIGHLSVRKNHNAIQGMRERK